MNWTATLVALGLLGVGVIAGTSVRGGQRLQCSSYCKAGNKFQYEPGVSYLFQYRASTASSVSGTSEEESRHLVSATAVIRVLSACELSLELEDARLETSVPGEEARRSQLNAGRQSEFSSALGRHPLQFSYQDGRIDQICPSSQDPAWVVNVKRGVLSVFQNSMGQLTRDHRGYETDVAGTCETSYYRVPTEGSSLVTVRKSKNLKACSHRTDRFISLPSTSYSAPIRSLPLIKSTQDCEQTITTNRTLHESFCKEVHLFRPFSNGENGAVTRVEQRLSFIETRQAAEERPVESPVRASLLFQHTARMGENSVSQEELVVSLLNQLRDGMQEGVQVDAPRVFASLVRALKTLKYPQLLTLFSRTKDPSVRRFLVDALPLVGTAEGMNTMTDLFKSGEVSSSDMDSWITSLSFQTRITHGMLLEANTLLEVYPSGATTLSVSTMVHSFCSETPDCGELGAVRDIMTRLEGPLRDHCGTRGDPRTEKLLLLALKAVGNAGVLVGPPDFLKKCHEQENPVEVRLAAISAYRRLPCDESSHHLLLNTYTDRREDTEVRIAAYLAVIKCPSARTLRRIKDTLYSEDVNQVASFVWTHLTNLQETSSPDKQTLKDMVANDFLQNKFNTDVRKFSRNYEASLFSETLNAGGTVDSNVIFSPESFLPRSASLNLTVDLFGEAFNVLEFGGRAEGLERYVEDLFGPDGYYPDKSLRKTLRNLKERFRSQQEGTVSTSARSEGELSRPAKASLYARVFGNELRFSQFEGLEDVTGRLVGLTSPWEVLSRILTGRTVDYSKSLVFLDASYVIPTSIGLPLEFAVNGSASIALKMGGKVDLEELWTRGSMEVQGHILPSVAVEFSGLMSVDAFVSKAGIRSASMLHSNTYLNGKAEVRNGKIVDIKINVPRDKVDILEVTSKLFLVGGAPESQELVELRGVVEDKEQMKACTPQTLCTLTGMQLCGELSYRNASRLPDSPYFPLTGPFLLSVSVDKTDVFDSYELNYRGVRELTTFKDQLTYQLNVDTPGSRVDRKLKLLFSLDNWNKAVKVNVMTPFFRLETDAKLEDDLNGKGFDVYVRWNDAQVLDARGAVRTSVNGDMGRYQPSFSLTVMNRKLVDLTGRVDFVTASKYSGDINLSGLTKDPVVLSGDLNMDRERWELSASFKANTLNGSVHSSARFNDDSMSVKATALYRLLGRKEQSVVFSAKRQRSLKGTLAQSSAYLNIQLSAFPQYGFELSLDEYRSSDYLDRRALLGLGGEQWWIGFHRGHKLTEEHTELSTLLYLTCPERGVDYKVDLLYQRLPSVIAAHALVNTPSKLWGSLKVTRAPSGQQDIKVELEFPWWTGSAKGRVSRPGPRRIETAVEAEWTPRGGKTGGVTLKGSLDDLSKARTVVFKGTLEAKGAVDVSLVAGLSSRSSNMNLWVIGTRGEDTFSGNITCSRDSHYSLTTSAQVGPKTYFTKLVLLNEESEKAIAVDLRLVRRLTLASKITFKGEEKGLEFEMSWDKDSDPEKRVSFLARSDHDKRELFIEVPGDYARAEMSTLPDGMRGTLEWSGQKKVDSLFTWDSGPGSGGVLVKLSTPFVGLEAQTLGARYSLIEQQLVVEGEISCQGKEARLEAHVTADRASPSVLNVTGSLTVNSSFPLIPSVTAHLDHHDTNTLTRSITTSLQFKHTDWHSQLLSEWTLSDAMLEGNVSWEGVGQSLSTDLYFLSGHDNLDARLQVSWSEKKRRTVSVEVKSERGSRFHKLFRVITPFDDFRDSHLELINRNDGSHMKADLMLMPIMMAGMEVKGRGNETKEGAGRVKIFKTRTWAVNFTHSTKAGMLEEAITVSADNKTLYGLDLHGGVESFPDNMDLHLSLKVSGKAVEGNILRRQDDTSSRTAVYGVWDEATVRAEVVSRYQMEGESVFHNHEVVLSSTFLKNDKRFSLSHSREPGRVWSEIIIPGEVNITHRFSAGSFLNWEHVVSLTSPRVNATVHNKMSYIPGEELMARSYIGSNALKILAEYNYTNNAEGRGAVATFLCPWTNPVIANLALSFNGSTVSPIMMVRYGEDKELRVQGEVMFAVFEGVLRLEVASPFGRQLSLDMAYSLADASVLVGVSWGDARLETGAVYHVEDKTYKLNAYIETPFKNWEMLSMRGTIKLSEEMKIFMLNVDGDPGFLPLTLYGNLKTSSDQFEVATAFISQFDALKNLTLHFHYMFPGMLNRGLKLSILKEETLVEVLGHYKFDEETIFKFGEAEFSLKTPLRSVETLGARLWYNLRETDAGLNVNKNGHKIEAALSYDGNNTFFKLNSPFDILRNVSVSMRRTFVPEKECTLNVVASYNGQAIELGGYLSSPDQNSVSASVEVRTPFERFKLVRFDYSFTGLHDYKKTGTITISKNDKRFDVTGTFSSVNMSEVKFNLHVDTPFKDYENMITGASYNALLSNDDKGYETLGKANLYFELEGARKDIYIDFSLKNSSASVKVTTPFKCYENLSISVGFSFDNDTFLGNSKLNCNSHEIDANVRVTVISFNSDVFVGATTSVQGFENVTLHARYNLLEREKTASLNAQLNGNDLIDLSISGFVESLEGRAAVSIQTYKKEFEAISLLASYDFTDDFAVKLIHEKNGDRNELNARLTQSTDKHVLRVETPFRGYRDVVLTLKHDMGDTMTLGVTLQKDVADTVVDALLAMNRSGILMILKTPFKSYRELRVSCGFSSSGVEETDYNISLTVYKNSVQVFQTSLTFASYDTKLGVHFKHSFGANEFEVSAWCYPGLPPKTLNIVVRQNNEIVASLEGTVEDLRGDGFTTHLQLTLKEKIRKLTVQFYPMETLFKASVDWDTTPDSFVVEFNYENITHALSIIVETPFPDFKGFSLSCSYGKDHILAELKTSVVGYEHLSARGSYKLAGNSPKFISFSASKNMDVINLEVYSDFRPHHFDVSMTVLTPFDSLDKLSLYLTHSLEERFKTFSFRIQISSDVYIAVADLSSAHGAGYMSLRLSTPLATIQKISIVSHYDFRPAMSNFMFVGEINKIKYINVKLETEHLTLTGRGILHFVRPFTGSTFSTQVSYDFSESYLLEGSLTIPSGALFDTSASVSHDFTGGNLSISATEQNSCQGVALSWDIENRIKTKKLVTSLMLGKNITYAAVLSLRQTRPMDVEAYFNVQIPYGQNYTGLAQVNLSEGKRKSGNIKVTWPHGQFVQFQGSFSLDPMDNRLALALSVDSSFTVLSNLFKMEDSVVNRENVLMLYLQTMFTNSKSLVSFSLESPLTQSLFLHLGYDFTSEDGSAVIDLSQGSFHMKIKTIINLTSNNPVVDMEISIPTLHVPLFHFRSQMFMKDSQYGLALTLQTNEQSLWEIALSKLSSPSASGISIFIHTPIDGFENFAVVAKLDRLEGISAGFQLKLFKYLELNASYSETYDVRFSVSGIMANYDPIGLESVISAKGSRKSWKMKLNVLGEQLELGAGSSFLPEGSFSVQTLFRSPWTQDIDVVGNYEANTGDEIDITIKHGHHVTTGKAKLTRSKTSNTSNVGLRFSFNNFSANLDTEIALGANISVNIRARLGQHSLQASLEYTNIRAIARIYCDTPFEFLGEIDGHSEVYFNVGEHSETHVTLMLRLDDRLYQFFMAATYANSHAYGNFTVSSPSFQIENEVFDIKVGAHAIDLNLLVNGENIKLKFGQILDWPVFSVNISADIPFIDRLKHVAFTSNINLLKTSVSTSAETSSGKRFSLTLNLAPRDFLIKLDTPYEIIPSLELLNKYSIEPHLVSKSTGKVNWKKHISSYEISSEFQTGRYLSHILLNSGENRIFELSASLIAPGTQWETIDTQFLLSYYSKTLSLQSHVDITVPDTTNVQLAITSPFKTLPELAVTAKLKNNDTQGLGGNITVIAFNQTMVIQAEAITDNLEAIEVKLVVYLPIYELPPLHVFARFSQQHWKAADAHVRVNFLMFEGQADASYELVDNHVDGKLVLDSPLFTRNISFSASLTGDTPRDMVLVLSLNENKVFLSYALQNFTTLVGKVKLDAPIFNLNDCGLDLTFSQGTKSRLSAAYRWHAHAGSLSISLEANPNMVILRGDADVPVLLGALPHGIRGSVEYSETGIYISLRYENGKSTNEISLLVRNDENLVTLATHADTRLTGVKDITLTIGKTLDQLEIDMWKSCYLKLNVNSENGVIICKCLNQEHVLRYHAQREHGFKGGLTAESPLLKNGKMNIMIDVTNVQGNVKAHADLMIADNHFKGTTSLSHLGKLTEIKIGLTSSSIQVFGLNTSGMITDTNVFIEVSLEIMAMVNRVTLRHQNYLPLDSELTILSPYLPHKLIRGVLKSQNYSVTAYAGEGAATFVPFLTLAASRSPESGSAELTFNAPSLSLCKHFSLHVVHDVAKDIYVSLGAKFSSEFVPTANVSVEFIQNQNVLEASIHIFTSLEGFEIVGAHVLVPLRISLDFSPKASVSLPYGHEYSLKAALRLLENRLEATFVGNFRTKKFGLEFAFLYGSIGKIQFEFNLPFGLVKHFRMDLTGHRSLTDGKDVVNFIEWNEERVELKYAGALDANKVVLHLELLTPFSQHKRYDLRLHYENMQRKVVTATLTFPGLPEDIGVQFDFLFHNILSLDFLGQITLPFLGEFNTVSLLFGNKMAGGDLKCVLASRYNENELTLALNGRLIDMGVNVDLSARLNEDETSLRIWGTPEGNGLFETSLELKTPLSKLRHVQIYLLSSFNPSDGIVANVSFNSRAIVNIVLSKDRTTGYSLSLDNPWRPVSVTFYYNLQDEFSIISEFCWDLKNKSHSTVGVKVILKPHADNRLEISTGIRLPTRTVLMDATYQDTPGRFEYINKFSWEDGQNVGCHVIVDTREVGGKKRAILLLRGDLLYRSFEVNVNREMDLEDKESRLVTELLWDALGDRSKKMALVMERIPNRTEVVFQHSGLPHQLTARTVKRSVTTAIELEYSPAKENKLTIEYSLDIAPDPERKLEARFAIHHNASLLNLQVALQAGVTPERVNGGLGIEYQVSRKGQMRLLHMSGSLSRSQPRLEASVRTSENVFSVGVMGLSGEDGYRGFNLRTQRNQKEPLSAELRFKLNHPILEFEMHCGDSRSYSVYAGMPNRREILFGARHTLDGVQTVDGLLMVKLNTSQLLWTKVQWRPEMFKDLRGYFVQELEDFFLMLDSVFSGISDFMEQDFLNRLEVFYPDTTEVYTYVRREMDDILQDLRGTASEIRAMYLRGDFFFKQIYDSTKLAINYLCEKLPFINELLDILEKVWIGTVHVLEALRDFLYLELSSLGAMLSGVQEALVSLVRSSVWYGFKFQYVHEFITSSMWILKIVIIVIEEGILRALEMIRLVTSNILDKYMAFMEPYVTTAQDILLYGSTVVMQARDKMTEVISEVMALAVNETQLQRLLDLYLDYSSWLEELHIQEYVDRIVALARTWREILLQDLLDILSDYKTEVTAAYQAVADKVSAMANVSEVTYFREVISHFYQKAKWVWHYYEISDQLVLSLRRFISNIDSVLLNLIGALDVGTMSTLPGAPTLQLRPDGGLFEYAQPLPVEWRGFDEIPRFGEGPLSRQGPEPEVEQRSGRYQDYSSPGLIYPPLTHHAVLAGDGHYITFSGVQYTLRGNCSYLLAGDLLDNRFSLLVNYQDKPERRFSKQSLTLITETGHHINIDTNTRHVTVNGKRKQLPLLVGGSTRVVRSGAKLLVSTEYGVSMSCDLHHDFCVVDLSEGFHGRTGGLLGPIDRGVSGTLTLPDGTPMRDVTDLARAWRVGHPGSCSESNAPPTDQHPETQEGKELCRGLYQDFDSPLVTCHDEVDYTPYYAMCLEDMSRAKDPEGALCASAALYITECNKRGMEVTMPQGCGHCPLPDGSTISPGEVQVFDGNSPHSSDIVLVVEQASCLQGLQLSQLTDKLDSALNLAGLINNRYSVVGFGGDRFPQPQTYTVDGEIWLGPRALNKAFRGLEFSRDTSNTSAALEALWVATHLSWRAGVSKTVVLVQCGHCEEGTEGYSELLNVLLETDITLHLLETRAVTLRVDKSSKGKVYGADQRGVFTGKNMRNLQPSAALLRQVALPKDLCTPLALETNGTLFNLERVLPSKSISYKYSTVKKFVDVWTRRLVWSAQPSSCQKCDCVLDSDGVPVVSCTRCITPSIEQFLEEWESMDDDKNVRNSVDLEESY